MPLRDPENWSLITWALVLGVGMMGGMVRWLNNVKNGNPRAFGFFGCFVEVFSSGFIGLMAFYLARSIGFNFELSLFFVGIAGHYGVRFLYRVQTIIEKQMEDRYGSK